ncbi:MAG: amidophosphoribosyltransferase [Candidatus Omnitrophica bacterium]|nr:amidophosphoribosyltransferase [Candidatus Omnitrophota bacterium]
MEEIKENCGLAGIYRNESAPKILYFSLFSLQHRGQESAGIMVSDGREILTHRGMGLVSEVFNGSNLENLKGDFGIGHVRYSTTGSSNVKNVQPFYIEYQGKTYGIAHNGNLVNSYRLKASLEKRGAIFQTTMDSEIILHLLVRSPGKNIKEKIAYTLKKLKGAFSLLFFTENGIIAARDSHGWRPLSVGKINNSYVIASETCAFDLIGAKYIKDVQPGEMLLFDRKGMESFFWAEGSIKKYCIFEFIYFARPDSRIFETSVYSTRKRLGEKLADEFPFDGDIVLPIPDSGNLAAIGFSQKRNIPLEMGIIKNHYIGRTFIQPYQKIRDVDVKIKLNPVRSIIENKNIIVIEDSIVRGTTCKNRVSALRQAGAKKIYMGVSCPPIISPCYYGIDFPSKKELIASNKSTEEIRKFLGLDGLYYLSLEGMLSSMLISKDVFCTSCFTGKYPVKPEKCFGKYRLGKCALKDI